MTEVFHKLVHAALLKLRQSPAVSTPLPPEVSIEHEIPLITFKIHELGVLII